jgi:hypothetical protein
MFAPDFSFISLLIKMARASVAAAAVLAAIGQPSAALASTGVSIKRDEAFFAMGVDSDVVFSRVGAGELVVNTTATTLNGRVTIEDLYVTCMTGSFSVWRHAWGMLRSVCGGDAGAGGGAENLGRARETRAAETTRGLVSHGSVCLRWPCHAPTLSRPLVPTSPPPRHRATHKMDTLRYVLNSAGALVSVRELVQTEPVDPGTWTTVFDFGVRGICTVAAAEAVGIEFVMGSGGTVSSDCDDDYFAPWCPNG